jgi:hypothetical protein
MVGLLLLCSQPSINLVKALGEKTGRTLFGQLTDLNKKISEVNLQVGNLRFL